MYNLVIKLNSNSATYLFTEKKSGTANRASENNFNFSSVV